MSLNSYLLIHNFGTLIDSNGKAVVNLSILESFLQSFASVHLSVLVKRVKTSGWLSSN